MDASRPSGRRARRRVGLVGVGCGAVAVLVMAGCDLGAPAVTYSLTTAPNSSTDLMLGDVDNDGHVDIVAAVHGGYTVGLGDASGGFAITQVQTFPAPGWLGALGDVDGDGNLDIVYIAGSPSGGPPQVEVRRGDGAGRFSTTRQLLPAVEGPRELALGDVDGDDDLDLAAATSGGAALWLNTGAGTFTLPVALQTGTNASDVALDDLDGDGDLDLVTGGFSPSAVVSVNLGDGAGAFSAPASYGLGPVSGFSGTTTIGVADMNGDGAADVYGGNGTYDQLFVFLGTGTGGGRLGPAIVSPARTATVPDLVAADIDVDGHLDLATGGSTVLFGDGAGHFPQDHAVYGGNMVVTSDFDANGQPDLAYAQGADMRVLLNHLDGRRSHDDA
jgi:hypothetical protein